MTKAPAARDSGAPGSGGATSRAPRLQRMLWLGLVTITLSTSAAVYFSIGSELLRNDYHWCVDFIVSWTAARAPDPYDFEALSAAQRWNVPGDVLRPFAYPPSFLPWLLPLSGLPMVWAYLIWTVATLSLFVMAWRRIVGLQPAMLALAAPTVALAVIPGQVVFLVGALLVSGISLAKERPVFAGILLGVAATIKPQMLVLVPLALAAGSHWRALAAALVTGLIVGLVCVLVQGTELWFDWLRSIPQFMAVLRDIGMMDWGITPTSALAAMGIEGIPGRILLFLAGCLGVITLWRIFRMSRDVSSRVLALNASTLLLLPYAMPYELALSAPAAVAMLSNRKLHPLLLLAAFMTITATGETLALLVICAVLIWAANRTGQSDEPEGVPHKDE